VSTQFSALAIGANDHGKGGSSERAMVLQ
jgi:hypothetical protein